MQIPIIKQLEEELRKLERELRIDLPKELQKAAAHGDLSENAEYKATRERQSYLQARIIQLQQRINSLSSVRLDNLPRDRVAFGARVSLEDLTTGEKVVYELVTPEEVDPRNGKISVGSPIGRALLNKGVGDEVVVHLPSGVKKYQIIDIATLHDMIKDSQ